MPALPKPPPTDAPAAERLGYALRLRRQAMPGIRNREQLAERLGYSVAVVKAVENGIYKAGLHRYLTRYEAVFGTDGEIQHLWKQADARATRSPAATRTDWAADAFELLRHMEASDLGAGSLEAIDGAVEALCYAYSSTPPDVLREQAGQHLAQIRTRLDGRLTLAQRRDLMVAAGWLALLLSALHFDVGDRVAAVTMRQVALQLGRQADHAEITAWSYETQAWFAVVGGRYGEAIDLARTGLDVTAHGTSASVQLAVQEARAWARRGDRREVKHALDRAGAALRRLPRPTRPEHHFVFDPGKLLFYQATCYARAGDAARAEDHAREVIRQSTGPTGQTLWPRRLVTARIDLGLALAQLGRPDEASETGALALESGSLVPSNLWQAAELDAQLLRDYATLPDARDFHERFVLTRRAIG